jgi:ectoine hydroxylase-related dioxygenase (phytanoyl-CoA dioxygenase family)
MTNVGELRESSLSLGPDELTGRFHQDGYLFFRRLLDPELVRSVRHDITHALAPLGWLAPGSDPIDAVPGELIRREADENWWGGYAAIQSLESFHRLAHDPAVLAPVRVLAGEDVLVHPRKIARVTYPRSGFPTPPHQDFPLIQGGTDVFTLWTPFGDCPREMGSLRLLEGSHRDGLREPVLAPGVGGVGVAVPEDDPRWRTADFAAGDAVIFLSLTVHCAPVNQGNRVRLSGDYRYQSVHEPVVEGSLGPHGYPAIAGWDTLADGWSSTAWIETPSPRVVEVRPVDGRLEAPASRFAGV